MTNKQPQSSVGLFLFDDKNKTGAPLFESESVLLKLINEKSNPKIERTHLNKAINGRKSMPKKAKDIILTLIKERVDNETLFKELKKEFEFLVDGQKISKLALVISCSELETLSSISLTLGGHIKYSDIPTIINLIRTNKTRKKNELKTN